MKPHLIKFRRFTRPVNSLLSGFSSERAENSFVLISMAPAFLLESHLSVLTKTLKFHFKRKNYDGSFFVNFKLCSIFTKKPIGVRMGKGKGPVGGKTFFLKPGVVLCFVNHFSIWRSRYILLKCIRKLPIRCRIVRLRNW